jgi:hypothetical protein
VGSATLTNAIATHVSAANPTVAYDSSVRLGSRTGGSGDMIAYIYFTRPFPLQATILSAKLVLHSYAFPENVSHPVNFLRMGVPWSASKITWNSRPITFISGTKNITKSGVIADKTLWELDITDWMQTVASGGPWHGIQIKTTEAIARYFYSETNPATAYRPRLEVTWSDAPATPSNLSPAGGRKVGVPKPLLSARFLDVSGATTMGAIQVQLNDADVWTSGVDYDSGMIPWSVPEFDLANPPSPAPAFTALADGQQIYWRVRFQDAAGVPSAWSASAQFQYDTKGTLTMINPPVGSPVVEDATPPIMWTFTGETQAAYQIKITHVANGVLVTDWDSRKVTSTDNEVTVPRGALSPYEATLWSYTVQLKVWDNKLRENTVADPPYAEVVRVFTFIPGDTKGTVNIAATPQDPRPKVALTWQREVAPDRFNILRNGRTLEAGLLPEDVITSSGGFTSLNTWADFNSSLGLWHVSSGGFSSFVRDTTAPVIEGTGQARLVRTWAGSGADFIRLDNGPLVTANRSSFGLSFRVKIRLNSGAPVNITAQILIYGNGADRAGPLVTLVPGAVVDVMATFTNAEVSAMQHMTIEFRRSFSTAVATTIDFDQVQQGNLTLTSYAWTDDTPSPKRDLVYTVQAVVADKASASNASVTTRVRSWGMWLREPDSGLEVVLFREQDQDFTLGEEGVTLRAIAETANNVVINQSLGGLEGRIEGELRSQLGKTAQQWRDQLIQLRALRVKRLLLTVGDYSFWVVARNWSVSPRALPGPVFKAAFDFYQQDSVSSILLGS